MYKKVALLALGTALVAGYGVKYKMDDKEFRQEMSRISEITIAEDEVAKVGGTYLPGYGEASIVNFGAAFDPDSIDKLKKAIGSSKRVVLNLNTPGGYVASLIELRKFLAKEGVELHTVVGSGKMTASCGAMLFMEGKTRTIAYGGEVLFHKSGGMAPDGRRNSTFVRDAIKVVEAHEAEIRKIPPAPAGAAQLLTSMGVESSLPAEVQRALGAALGSKGNMVFLAGGYDGLIDILKTELGDINSFDRSFLKESTYQLSPEALDKLLKTDGNLIYRYGSDAEEANVATHVVM